MTSLVQISLCFLTLQLFWLDIVRCKPMGEMYFRKTFDVGFKPKPFKPLTFIKEKWVPLLGKFGIKTGLVKRDLDSVQGIQKVTPVNMGIETRLPAEVYEVEPPGVLPATVPLSKEIVPLATPPLSPVLITPPPKVKESGPINGLFTDIGRVDTINEFLKNSGRLPSMFPFLPEENALPPISNAIGPEKPKVEPPPIEREEPSNPFLRGSRFALYMGNMLLDILTQFLSRTVQPISI